MKIKNKYTKPTGRLITFDMPIQLMANSGDEPEQYDDANLELIQDQKFDKNQNNWL